MKRLNTFIFFLIITLTQSIIFAQKIINRYGLELVRNGDSYTLKDERKIRCLNVFNLDSVPVDMLIPYQNKRLFIRNEDYSQCETRQYVFKKGLTRDLTLEVDMPKDTLKEHPYIIWIHGGGWHMGDLNGHKTLSKYMASHGITGIRISYSLLPEGATFKDTWKDIEDAIAYIQENAKEFRLDIDRFGFAGHSAGGHLAAYAAMRTPKTKLLVSFNGVYDMNHVEPGWVPTSRHDNYFGTSVENRALASPISFVHEKAPYCVLTYSSGDCLIDKNQIKRFESKLKEFHIPYEILEKDFYSHTAFIDTDLYEPMLMKLLILANKHL